MSFGDVGVLERHVEVCDSTVVADMADEVRREEDDRVVEELVEAARAQGDGS